LRYTKRTGSGPRATWPTRTTIGAILLNNLPSRVRIRSPCGRRKFRKYLPDSPDEGRNLVRIRRYFYARVGKPGDAFFGKIATIVSPERFCDGIGDCALKIRRLPKNGVAVFPRAFGRVETAGVAPGNARSGLRRPADAWGPSNLGHTIGRDTAGAGMGGAPPLSGTVLCWSRNFSKIPSI